MALDNAHIYMLSDDHTKAQIKLKLNVQSQPVTVYILQRNAMVKHISDVRTTSAYQSLRDVTTMMIAVMGVMK